MKRILRHAIRLAVAVFVTAVLVESPIVTRVSADGTFGTSGGSAVARSTP